MRGSEVPALRTFRGNLTSNGTAAGGDEVCAGSTALAMLTSSAGAAALRAAEAQLSAADPILSGARAGPASVVPPASAYMHRRLANGALVRRAVHGG